MCSIRNSWQQYAYTILLLICVLVSNSSQQIQINKPQPFQRHSKAVGDNVDGFQPIVAPVNQIKSTLPPAKSVDDANQNDEQLSETTTKSSNPTATNPTAIAQVDQNERIEKRSINIRFDDLERLAWLFVREVSRSGNGAIQKRSTEPRALTDLIFGSDVLKRVKKFTEKYIFEAAGASALKDILPNSGRLFLFKGFKKMMWPLFIGVQVVKTVLLAMFLPSILGSIGKMVGKGLVSVSGFGHPTETVDDFEFKDNPPPEDPPGAVGYNYPAQSQLTPNHANVEHGSFDTAPAANNMLSLYDIAEPKPQFTLANTYTLPEYAQNSRKETVQSKKDDFKVFHDIPASSMLLTNYDPFYSPLLSRLDAVFHQLNLDGDNEACREKLVCLMYSSPAKYMPYSNLVSAQLSRELNELRKPTSDNVEILRFFKYMRAARDGQDGKNCHNIYKKCSSFTDTDQPAMLTTFNDINKLVSARKIQ